MKSRFSQKVQASPATLRNEVLHTRNSEWAGERPAHTYKEREAQLVLRPAASQMMPALLRLVVELAAVAAVTKYALEHHWKMPWWLPLAFALAFIARSAWVWLGIKTDYAAVDQGRITFRRGVLNRVSASVEFARIQNVLAHQAWWQRIFGTGTVLIQTTDRAIKNWTIAGVRNPHEMRERILRAALASRHYHGTSEALIGAL
ncbi:PH domain-containing protein [Burkholderia multivorans]|uniref:PH domain-containing protein n=1 Tax=Burkholderia multivorans TaxID=87883 RepID=UPI0021BE7F31|nr:PH domain-containing protein [Burkholderia multivorans]